MTRNVEAIRRLFGVAHNRARSIEPLASIFPGHMAPVVRVSTGGERELVSLSWGFVLPQKDRAPKRVTNVRDDTITTSAFWRESFAERRCIVPASSFCEPNGEVSPATWNWFALHGDEPRPLFAFPGIWRRHKGPIRKGGDSVEVDVFAFMTTVPNGLVATVNHERMPVILTDEAEFATWLTGTTADALGLVRSYPAERMRQVKTGYEKADAGEATAASLG